MTVASPAQETVLFHADIENRSAPGRVVLVCEHASNHIPPQWGDLGLEAQARQAHIAWDPGALALARALSRQMDAVLVHAPVSRLVYDLNRAPDHPGAMPAQSEIYAVPGNAAVTAAERAARTAAVYVPFHDDLHIEIARRIALGLAPVLITIHSFTPIWHGVARAVEFGVIHDADDRLARHIVERSGSIGLHTELNAPYSAADGVTHTLRLQAGPYRLPNVMLEVRNDLLSTPLQSEAIAERLAPVLMAAVADLSEGA